jgi:transcriptional regulator with XRE-family HTH domain
MINIGEKLKELRLEIQLSQKKIANLLNISVTTYAGYEQGYREPNLENVKKLCEIFDVTAGYLLDIENEDGTKAYKNNTYKDNFKNNQSNKNYRNIKIGDNNNNINF